jgi:hypothetical protein
VECKLTSEYADRINLGTLLPKLPFMVTLKGTDIMLVAHCHVCWLLVKLEGLAGSSVYYTQVCTSQTIEYHFISESMHNFAH